MIQAFCPNMDRFFIMRVSLLQKKARRLCMKHRDAKVSISIEMHGQKFIFESSPGLPAKHQPLASDPIQQPFEDLRIGVGAAITPLQSHVHKGPRPAWTDEVPPYKLTEVSHEMLHFFILLIINVVLLHRTSCPKVQPWSQCRNCSPGQRLRRMSLI